MKKTKEVESPATLSRQYVDLYLRRKEIEDAFKATEAKLKAAVGPGERIEVQIGDWEGSVLCFERERVVTDEVTAELVNGIVPGGWKKCQEEKLSVTKLHALEALYPALKLAVPYASDLALKVTEAKARGGS